MLIRSRVLALLLLVAGGLTPCAAQIDPPAPPGGFPIVERLDRQMAFSDGYLTCYDLRRPAVVHPTGRWPGVLLCHGAGGSRKSVAGLAQRLAAAGYAVMAHDHRTMGCTRTLNPTASTSFSEDRQLLDFAEAFVVFEQQLPNTLDSDRLAMAGTSMGAYHSYAGAAWAGRALPLAGYVSTFPDLLAVAGQIGPVDRIGCVVPGGVLLRAVTAGTFTQSGSDPKWVAAEAGQYQLLPGLLAGEPITNSWALVRTNDVPVYARVGYEDSMVSPASALDPLGQLPPGVPGKGLINGNGHGTPSSNVIEGALYGDDVQRWFDRFLKQIPNGITEEPAFEAAVTPLDPRYLASTSAWEHRSSATWPPATPAVRSYLRGDGTLSETPPSGVEPGRRLPHRVPAGYDLATFLATSNSGKNATPVLQSIPLVSYDFAGPVLTEATELFGRTRVQLSVLASTGDFQISAALLVRDALGAERFLAGGTGAVRGQSTGAHQVEFELRDVATVVDAGSQLVLRVENLSHRRPPGQSTIEFVPWLGDFDVAVLIGPAGTTHVDLPILPARGVGLTPRLADVEASSGIDHTLDVDAGPERANVPYVLLMSASGFGPGLSLAGITVPLNPDPSTLASVQLANSVALPGFAGLTDGSGQATGRLHVPAPMASALEGLRLTFACVLLDGSGFMAGGPAQLVVLP